MGFINKIRNLFKPEEKSGGYEKLWQIGHENQLFGNRVNNPYGQISSVYKAIKAIADNVPQADIAFYDKKTNKEVFPDELISLFNAPNPMMSGKDFLQAIVGFYALYGELMIIKWESMGQRAGTRKLPAELWTFNPSKFQHVESRNNLGQRIIAQWRYDTFTYSPEEIIHMRDFNPSCNFRGQSPLGPIDKIIDIDYQTLLFNKAFFDNDGTPGFVLSTDKALGKEQVDRLRDWWEKRHKGASKAFRMAVLEGGLKPSTIGATHKDMDFIEQKRFTREEILGIWRAPKALFNITEDLNYATFVGQMKMFWIYTLMPILRKVEDGVNKGLVTPYNPNIVMRFDTKNVPAFQEDFKEKVDTATKLFNLGVPLNDINEKLNLGLEQYPWGNIGYLPFSLQPAGQDQSAPDPVTDPAQSQDDPQKPEAKAKIANHATWKTFLSKQVPLERGFEKKIKNYFSTQKTRLISYVKDSTVENIKSKVNSFEWERQNEILKDRVRPFILGGIQDGVDIAKSKVKSKSVKSINDSINSYLTFRLNKITEINKTIQRQIGNQLDEGVKNGDSITALADRIALVYETASVRSITIARTETVGAVNGGSVLYYNEAGITQKEWVTAGDEHVRESHRSINGEVVNMSKRFGNGLEYPGDQSGDASEVINCRCTLSPVVD